MLIDCRAIAVEIDAATGAEAAARTAAGHPPAAREILATDDEAVRSYVRTKARKAAALGIDYRPLEFGRDAATADLLDAIAGMNAAPSVHGIMLGLPLYAHLDAAALADAIAADKDIDGLGADNTARLATGREERAIAPATAVAAVRILETVASLAGRKVAVLGRGRTVGRPVAAMLVNRDSTVTICHSRSRDLAGLVAEAEIVVSAIGRPHFVDAGWLRAGQVVVDCGISFVGGRTVGDVDSAAADAAGAIVTPVPGGVGAVTNAMIFANLMRAMRLQRIGGAA
jgi:methylenetetrahydrofolate dehydrogenase (NADP+)/methenyltetrahydrofolate cyclohydrolase